jgi:hypothetical protein
LSFDVKPWRKPLRPCAGAHGNRGGEATFAGAENGNPPRPPLFSDHTSRKRLG